MTITNGYITLAEFKTLPQITTSNSGDDTFIEGVIERVSRQIDDETEKWFYADTQTRVYDIPRDRQLDLDAPLLSVTSITNGDGNLIAASDYLLLDPNVKPYYAIRLKQTSSSVWQYSTTTGREQAISIVGTWGWISQSNTDQRTVRIISNLKVLCLEWSLATYRRRYGAQVEGMTEVSVSGVIIPPKDLSIGAYNILRDLKSLI